MKKGKDDIVVEQEYWDKSYSNFEFYEANDELTNWLNKYYLTPFDLQEKTMLEIGCFPGRYLVHFGRKGMKVSGLDLTPNLKDLPKWLKSKDIICDDFYNENILTFSIDKKYDLVCSFGFIEHFRNYIEIIKKHIDLNSDQGAIIITTPNFKGLGQQFLHRSFDNINLKRHNLNAMNPNEWAKILNMHGYTIVFKGYFGKFNFWHDTESTENSNWLREKFYKHLYHRLKNKITFNSKFLSPYCGIIAIKTKLDPS